MNHRYAWGTLLVRLTVGWVFLSEGIQKFLFPALGPERFAKIGFPAPHALALFVGGVEMVCGAMVILGLWLSWACLPLLAVIATAIATTKVPLYFKSGFWPMMHEARVDYCMLLGLLALLLMGTGPIAIRPSRRW